MENTSLSDSALYALCKQYGSEALAARRRFAGLLPEVYKRGLYRKKGFFSIYEFAARLAGMTKDQVDIVLRLERRFVDLPVLHKALTSGRISANKLARVASVASAENQEELVERAVLLSKNALEVWIKEMKAADTGGAGDLKSLPGQTVAAPVLRLASDVEAALLELQNKGIDLNAFLREALAQRIQAIAVKKEQLAKQMDVRAEENAQNRYIPAAVRRVLQEEHGTRCAHPHCARPAENLHHTRRFAVTASHDPRYIAPLCKAHHELAHAADVRRRECATSSSAAVGP